MEIDFHPLATAELDKSFRRYRKRSSLAASRFLDAVEEGNIRIVTGANDFPFALAPCRRCPVKRFPFDIIYRVIENSIVIVAIAHSKRRPNYWRKRV